MVNEWELGPEGDHFNFNKMRVKFTSINETNPFELN